jgi:hypothetical protein
MNARSIGAILAASAAVLFTGSAHSNPPVVTGSEPIVATGEPAKGGHNRCVPKAGATPSLGCTRMIEYYRKEIRATTAGCKAGTISADTCARNLKNFQEAIDELTYHPQ